jgi:hypothetical protein
MIAEVQMTLTRPEVHVELTVDQQRWCADWLAQFFWAIDNDLEDLTNLYVPHRSTNPRTKGTYDPEDGKIDTAMKLLSPFMDQPDLWAYTCYIPPHEELEFPGAKVYLYPEETAQIGARLHEAGLFALWKRYAEGGTYQIWYHHRTHNRMQLTRKARYETGIDRVSMELYGYFESEIRHDMRSRVLYSV